jgi:saccharopine dehydrogenase-like NADP-dependent oxidoreductase
MSYQLIKQNVLVVGFGRLGSAIIRRLQASENYCVSVADPHYEALQEARLMGIEGIELSGAQYQPILKNALRNVSAVICAAPDFVALDVAKAAREIGCHYLDVSENSSTRRQIAALAVGARSAFVPGCGLAPGYVTSLATEILSEVDPQAQVTVYVGVLPQQKNNRLGYGNMWGIDGLMTEYSSACLAVRNSQVVALPPLSELEDFYFNGMIYEAFTTAGTLDDLVYASAGGVGDLVFKTLRYPGHLDYMKFLIDDLGLGARKSMLKNLMLNGLPKVDDDQLIISVETRNPMRSGIPPESLPGRRYELHFTSTKLADGRSESSVAMASAAHVCSVMDLLCRGGLRDHGLISHSEINLGLLSQSAFFKPLRKLCKSPPYFVKANMP